MFIFTNCGSQKLSRGNQKNLFLLKMCSRIVLRYGLFQVILEMLCVLLLTLALSNQLLGQSETLSDSKEETNAKAALQALNSQFEIIENKGQWNDEVYYMVKLPGGNAWFTKDGYRFDAYKKELKQDSRKKATTHKNPLAFLEEGSEKEKADKESYEIKGQVYDMNLIGLSPTASYVTEQAYEGHYNYLIGKDVSKHASFVKRYKGLVHKNVYTGIDVRYYSTANKQLEFDFIIGPKADMGQIAFNLEGQEGLYEKDGELHLKTKDLGDLVLTVPISYQMIDGKRQNVEMAYKIEDNTIRFEAKSAINEQYALIIDPVALEYATFLNQGYGEGAKIFDMELDASNNIYLVGMSGEGYTNFPTTVGAYQTTVPYLGDKDIAFITKFNAGGRTLSFSTLLGGGRGRDRGTGIVVDASNNVYISGLSRSIDFPTTSGAYRDTEKSTYGYLSFATKLNATGSALIYSTYIGGTTLYSNPSIALDQSNNAVIAIHTDELTYPTTPGAYQTTYGGGFSDVAVTKLNATGSALIFSTFFGGSDDEGGLSTSQIALDANDNVCIAGYTKSNNFPTTVGAYQTTFGGGYDGFITKLKADGSGLVFSTFVGGSSGDGFLGFTLDANDNIYACGWALDGYPTTSGAYQTSFNSIGGTIYGGVVTKLSSDGSSLDFSTYLAATDLTTYLTGISIDASNNIYLLGYSESTTLPTTANAIESFGGSEGGYFLYYAKLNNSGAYLDYATYFRGSGLIENNTFSVIAVDNTNKVHLAYHTLKRMATTADAFNATQMGGHNDYIVNLNIIDQCVNGYVIPLDTLSPSSQTVCKNGFVEQLVGQKVVIPSDSLPTLYLNGVESFQNEIEATYQWQESTSASGPWVDIFAAIQKNYSLKSSVIDKYYRRVSLNIDACGTDTLSISAVASVLINAFTAPVVDGGGQIYTCPGFGVTLGGSPSATGGLAPYSYSWDNISGASAILSNPTVTPSENTVYTLTVEDANGCKQKDQAVVTVYVANAGPNVSACAGDSVRIEAVGLQGVPGMVYNWTPTTGLSNSTVIQPMAKPASVTDYTFNVTVPITGGGTCTTSDVVTVRPVSAPSNPNFAGNDVTLCFGESAPLGVAVTANSYTWAPSIFLTDNDINRPTFDGGNIVNFSPNPNPVTYSLTIVKNDCVFSDDVTVNVIHADANLDGCGPRQIGLDYIDVPDLAETFTWTKLSGGGNILGSTNTPTTAVSASPSGQPTTYRLETSLNGVSCFDEVFVPSCGTGCAVRIDLEEGGRCPNYSLGYITLIATTSGLLSDYTYSWTPMVGLSAYNTRSVNLTDGIERTYTVTVTNKYDPSFSCSESLLVNSPSLSVPSFTATDASVCSGATINIGDAPVAGYSYNWSPSDDLSLAISSNPSVTVTTSQNFNVTVTDDETGCIAKDTATIIVVNNNSANAGPDWVICGTAILTLGTLAKPNTTYSWSPAIANYQNGTDATFAQPDLLVTTTQSYVVTASSTLANCSDKDTVNILLDPNPVLDAPNVFICLGDSKKIGLPRNSPGVTYSWSPGATLSDSTVAQPIATPATTTTYTLIATYTPALGGGCDVVDEVTVTVGDPSFTLLDRSYCPLSGPVILGDSAPTGMSSYSWLPAALVTNPNIRNPSTLDPPPNGGGNYLLKVTDSNGCTASDVITITPLVTQPIAGSSRTICLNETTELGSLFNEVGVGINYSWSPATGLSSSTSINPTFTPSSTGTFSYTVTKTKPGCTNTGTVSVTVQGYSINLPQPSVICQNGSVEIGVPSEAGVQYFWYPTTGLTDSLISMPTATLATTTTYTLTAIGTNGCITSKDITVGVNSSPAPTVTLNDTTACFGSSLPALISSVVTPSGDYDYLWSPNDGSIANIYAEDAVVTIGNLGTKSYTLQVTDAIGCLSLASAELTVEDCSLDDFTKIDTIPIVLHIDSTETICVDTTELLGRIVSISGCGNPVNGSTSNLTGVCVDYTAPGFAARDTFCVVICDDLGFCDTTIIVTSPIIPKDTIPLIVPVDSTVTVCIDTTELPGNITSISSCGDPVNGSTSNLTGVCVDYTAPGFAARDTFCVVICDDLGFCDTTIVTIKIPTPKDTIPFIVPADSMITVCIDTMELPGTITSISSCGDPINGTTSNYNPLTGCVDYTAPSTPGVRDTFCVEVCDDMGFCDTTIVTIKIPIPTDTIPLIVPVDSTVTVCIDTTELPGNITSISSCGNPINGTTSSYDLITGCVDYTAPSTPGVRDTFCVEICDDMGFCDTTIVTIKIPIPTDTIPLIVPVDSTVTVCIDTTELPGNIISISSCGDPINGTTSSYDLITGCVDYTAPSTPGVRDTFCVEICDDMGFCDTTIVTIKIPIPTDTIPLIVPVDSTVTVCIDTTELPGNITSISSCGNPINGTTSSYDLITGCVDYTAPNTPGVRDTFCVEVCDDMGFCDTTIVTIKIPIPTDTIPLIVPVDSTVTVCIDTTELPGNITSISSCGDPINGTTSNYNPLTGCVDYTAPNTPGVRDTFCVEVCDDMGFCDTTIVTIKIPIPTDTIPLIVPVDSTVTVCIDTTELPGNITSISSCGNPINGTTSNYDLITGCVDYTAPNTPGVRDTFCVEVCDDMGFCDTTIVTIKIPIPTDTIPLIVPVDSTVTVCVDTTELPGNITSISSCGDPINGTTSSYDLITGCVDYTAPSTPGVRDTFCVEVCDDMGFCDTTIVTIKIPIPTDTIPLIVPVDSTVTVCIDTTGLPGNITSISSCGDPVYGTTSSYDPLTGCVDYTAPNTPGVRDTFCVEVCDDMGFCDTTIVTIKIPIPTDTIPLIVPVDSTVTVCIDTTELPGNITSISSCGDPINGTTSNYNPLTGCIDYTAPNTPGVRDTFCVEVCDDMGFCDTTIVTIKIPIPTDTIPLIVPVDSTVTVCIDTTGLPGNITSISSCGDPVYGTTSSYDPLTGCVDYTAPNTPGVRDTFCVEVCDDMGFCDTTIVTIKIPIPTDTIPLIVPVDSTVTVCIDTTELPGNIISISSCGDPVNGTTSSYDLITGCVDYTAPNTPGVRDTFCVEVCDDMGFCDTTIVTIKIPIPTDTIPLIVPVDSTVTVCIDTTELPGNITSISSCGDPINGTTSNYNPLTGCVDYTAPNTPGVRDTFCVEVCDDMGFCDTIIITTTVPLTPDTIPLIVPADSTVTVCIDTTELPGNIISISSCGDPVNGTTSSYDLITGCVDYTAPNTPGVRDTFCVEVCDDMGFCDTTIVTIKIPIPTDTIPLIVPVDSTVTVCIDTTGLLGNITSISSCGDPVYGTTSSYDPLTGCVDYTAPNTPGVRDTFCVEVCDDMGFCDTTIVTIKIPIPTDTIPLIVPVDSTVTVCIDTTELPGNITSISSCGDPVNGTTSNYNPLTGCVDYTAPSTPGVRDTFCVEVCDDMGFCDTTIVTIKIPIPTDTIPLIVPVDSTVTVCIDTTGLPGNITSISSCGDPVYGTTSSYDPLTGCVDYTAPNTPGVRDTFCVEVCDDMGFCDTTIVTIKIPIPTDTIPLIVPVDSTVTVCVDTTELPGNITSISSCGDPINGTTSSYDLITGCVDYTAPSTPGVRDTFCVEVCDDMGFCDTTIVTIKIPIPTDTIPLIVPVDSTVTVCIDTTGLPGNITSISSCGDPVYGTTSSYDPLTGCVDYTAPNTPGVRDTFCVEVCDDMGFCDTTIVTIKIPIPTDTIPLIVPVDSTVTVCIDTTELPGNIISISSCGDPVNGTTSSYDLITGCVDYTAPNTPGVRDTFCVEVCDDMGFCDTTIVTIKIPIPTDTIPLIVPADSTVTVCIDTTGLPGNITSISSCGDPINGTASNYNPLTGCVDYTAPNIPGVRDTFCVEVCDDMGFCDTIIITTTIPLTPDTIPLIVPADSTVTVCVDTTELPGNIISISSCGDPINGTTSSYDLITGCVDYTAPSTPGVRDTFCVEVCDDMGFCDTTIVTIKIPIPTDTIPLIVPVDSTVTVCIDTTGLPGNITSISSCGDPINGTASNYNPLTGCVDYTAPNIPGVRDTFCVEVCDDMGFCDTIIITTTIPLTPDTIPLIVPADSTVTVCIDTTELPGNITSISSCGDPINGTTSSYDLITGCVDYTAPNTPGVRDTFCVEVCDDMGFCDTTIVTIKIPIPTDTIPLIVPVDSTVTVCIDTTELPGNITSISSCGNPINGTTSNYDLITGCVDYTAPNTPGVRDTFCVEVCDDMGFCDTTIVTIKIPIPTDTIPLIVPVDSTVTVCVDTTELPGNITSISSCGDPINGTTSSYDLITGCVDYTAPSTPGVRDTFCVEVCDDMGFCDTTIVTIKIPIPTDTIPLIVPVDSTVTVCIDTTGLPGNITSISSCGDPVYGTTSSYDPLTGCVDYTAPNTPGVRDTFCVEVCDDMGFCDTTIVTIKIPIPTDTIPLIVPVDSTVTVCIDTTELPGNITSISSCGDPINGTTSNYNPLTGCIDYTAPNTPGVRDTFCVEVCDDMGFCDTTIVTIKIPIPTDTIPLIVPVDSTVTVCIDTTGLPGNITSISSCGDPVYGTTSSYDPLTGCVDYTAPNTPGVRDTFCVEVCDDMGFCDTTIVTIKIPIPTDTIPLIVPVDSTVTVCIDTTELPGNIISISSCGDPVNGTTSSYDLITGCVDYTAPNTPGVRDTFCVEVCDDMGFCDTTIVTIKIPIPTDTIPLIVPVDSTVTVCIDTTELPGNITSISSCGDPINGTTSNYNPLTGCVDYTAPNTPGVRDTFCVEVCDDMGFCDTIIITTTVPLTPDTIPLIVPADSTVTVCIDTTELPGNIISISSCGDPVNGTTSSYDLITGCVDYTAPNTPGVRDTFCVEVCDDMGFCDTTIVTIKIPIPTDTIPLIVPVDSTVTVCIDTTGLLGNITSISSCGDPVYGTTSSYDPLTGCVDYTAPNTPGVRDTFCVEVCDDMGFCDTTIVTIKIPIPTDTIPLIVPVDSTVTVCIDTTELPGNITSISSCGDPVNGTTSNYNPLTGCVDYTAPSTPGVRDTFCVEVCDDMGFCDTTIVTIKIPIPTDTIPLIVPVDSTVTVCIDTTGLPGNITSISSCGDPVYGTTSSYDPLTGCVDYTAPNTPGVRDTFCVEVCDDMGFCDTIIITTTIPLTPDTIPLIVPADSTVTVCIDTTELPGNIISISSCGDPVNGTTSNYDLITGCVDYTAPNTPGVRDTFCVEVCDDMGFCDTTIVTIKIPIPTDTIPIIVPVDSTVTVCIDTTGLPGNITSISSCGDPINGTTSSYNPLTGCVDYTAPNTPGVRDTFCVEVCDDMGFCDTIIITTTIPLTPDTIPLIVPVDSTVTVCIDTTGLPGNITSINSCGDPINGTTSSYDLITGCVDYTAPNTPGVRDTFCVEVCDDMGFCDTTTVTITIPLTSDTVKNTCITISASVFLEGPYKNGSMYTKLNDLGYLPGQDPVTFFGVEAPVGQPYDIAPWNYFGKEGDMMDYTLSGDPKAGYAPTVVDWVLVSLRTEIGSETTVCQRAALLHADGHISFLEDQLCCEVDLTDSYYVVIEHRNHLVVMSHQPIPVSSDNTIAYDFRTQQSFRGLLGFGQKEIASGVYVMFAGNGEQTNSGSSDTDINVGDKDTWLNTNGDHSSYYFQDFDLNGDTNVQDKNLWLENNGKFSDVPRL